MHHHARSIYGCGEAPAEFPCPRDCRLTYNPITRRIYVHVFAWPFVEVHLEGWPAERIDYVQLLNDASEVKVEPKPEWQNHHGGDADPRPAVTLRLPVQQPRVTVPVIEVFLK